MLHQDQNPIFALRPPITRMCCRRIFTINPTLALLCGFALAQGCGCAATLWEGPMITFTEPAGGIGSNPADQDRLTPDVWLTRNVTEGIFNAAKESGYTHFSSPLDTEWAYGSLANYASLSYLSWEGWNGHNPPSMVNRSAVVHLISDDVYLSLKFLSWPTSGGGFSYERSTSSVPEPSTPNLGSAAVALALLRLSWRKLKDRNSKPLGHPTASRC